MTATATDGFAPGNATNHASVLAGSAAASAALAAPGAAGHAAVGDRRADARHRERRREVAVLADRACADREVVGQVVRDRARLERRDRQLLVEAEPLGVAD